MKILNSHSKKNNKLNRRSIRLLKTKKSKRLIKNNRYMLKNGGGKKEDLIKQIGDIIDKIYSIERAAFYGSQWCNAPGPNPECDRLEEQQKALIEEFKSEFPEKELYDALDLRRRQREYEEDAPRRQREYEEAQQRELRHKQWLKEQAEQERARLEREYTEALNAYKTKIVRMPKDDSSLEEERVHLEMWFDNVVKSCRDEECLKRQTKLYNEKKKILKPHLDATPSGQIALQRARERDAAEYLAQQKARAQQQALDKAAAEQRAQQQALDKAAAEQREKRKKEIDELKMASASFGKILNKKHNK